jgi:glycosyltransferase involved in cell wall biosynthesis
MLSSVIIITKNRCRSLKRALDSISLGKVLPGEIIVIDNASDDKTGEVVSNFNLNNPDLKIRYVVEKQVGFSYARNSGLQKSRGDILAFTDDDCIVDKNWLKNIIDEHKLTKAAAIGGETLDFPTNVIGYTAHILKEYFTCLNLFSLNKKRIEKKPRRKYVTALPTSNLSFKKKSIKNILFRTELKNGGEDIDFCWRLNKLNKKNVLFCSKIKIHHENRKTLYGFFLQVVQTARSNIDTINIARKNNYLPESYKLPFPSRALYLFRFFKNKLSEDQFTSLQKMVILFLLLSAFSIFAIFKISLPTNSRN